MYLLERTACGNVFWTKMTHSFSNVFGSPTCSHGLLKTMPLDAPLHFVRIAARTAVHAQANQTRIRCQAKIRSHRWPLVHVSRQIQVYSGHAQQQQPPPLTAAVRHAHRCHQSPWLLCRLKYRVYSHRLRSDRAPTKLRRQAARTRPHLMPTAFFCPCLESYHQKQGAEEASERG